MKRLSVPIKEAISRELATVALGKRMVQWSKGMQNSGSSAAAAKARGLYGNKLNERNLFSGASTSVTEKQHPLNKLYKDSVRFFNRTPDASVIDEAILPKARTYNRNYGAQGRSNAGYRSRQERARGGYQRSNEQRQQYRQEQMRNAAVTVAAGGLFMGGLAAADNYFSKRDAAKEPQEKAASVFKESFTSVIIKAASNRD